MEDGHLYGIFRLLEQEDERALKMCLSMEYPIRREVLSKPLECYSLAVWNEKEDCWVSPFVRAKLPAVGCLVTAKVQRKSTYFRETSYDLYFHRFLKKSSVALLRACVLGEKRCALAIWEIPYQETVCFGKELFHSEEREFVDVVVAKRMALAAVEIS